MAKQMLTNGQLAVLLQDIVNIEQSSPALELFNRTRIARIRNENKERIDSLNQLVFALAALYVKKDAEGKPLIEKVNNTPQFVFIDEEAQAEYSKHYKILMDKTIDIVI